MQFLHDLTYLFTYFLTYVLTYFLFTTLTTYLFNSQSYLFTLSQRRTNKEFGVSAEYLSIKR